jgi:hypothetical protein
MVGPPKCGAAGVGRSLADRGDNSHIEKTVRQRSGGALWSKRGRRSNIGEKRAGSSMVPVPIASHKPLDLENHHVRCREAAKGPAFAAGRERQPKDQRGGFRHAPTNHVFAIKQARRSA